MPLEQTECQSKGKASKEERARDEATKSERLWQSEKQFQIFSLPACRNFYVFLITANAFSCHAVQMPCKKRAGAKNLPYLRVPSLIQFTGYLLVVHTPCLSALLLYVFYCCLCLLLCNCAQKTGDAMGYVKCKVEGKEERQRGAERPAHNCECQTECHTSLR